MIGPPPVWSAYVGNVVMLGPRDWYILHFLPNIKPGVSSVI